MSDLLSEIIIARAELVATPTLFERDLPLHKLMEIYIIYIFFIFFLGSFLIEAVGVGKVYLTKRGLLLYIINYIYIIKIVIKTVIKTVIIKIK